MNKQTITGADVAAHFARKPDSHKVHYLLWDGEVWVEAFAVGCAYGFVRGLIVSMSMGDGLQLDRMKTFDPWIKGNRDAIRKMSFEQRQQLVFDWIAKELHNRARGTSLNDKGRAVYDGRICEIKVRKVE